MQEKTPSEQIDDIISMHSDWRGELLARLRALIAAAAPELTEEVKWKKPSKPEGVATWTLNGKNVCVADILKEAVRLTFTGGNNIPDPNHVFNTRLDSKVVRAIDFYKDSPLHEQALQNIVRAAAGLHT
ncbi:MAG TPA: DUF1801 domain-containing protein [Candidatus Saccharimonadales bacterium]|nr:DUF1801 domain-containing protein [Candidatus Saccharimonadales bacterium]